MQISPRREEREADAPKTAVLLIAHGSREANANDDLYYLAEQLRRHRPYAIVEAAFLELVEPNIEQGGNRCVALGANRVVLLPYFLSPGIHVTRDLTQACRSLTAQYPHVEFRLAAPLGRHPLLVQVLIERAQQAEDQV
jgi:sirohydrochlorin ferrochelatase